jgi:tape measure domain-containing protein
MALYLYPRGGNNMALQVGELFASLRLDDQQFHSGMGKAEGDFQGFGGKLLGMASKYAALLGASIAAGMSVKTGIEYNAVMEQSKVAWTTLLGTATEAQGMLRRISDFAKATPFQTADVDIMAKYMHNAGLEGKGLFDALMQVSDVASAFAIPASEAKELTRQMSQVRQAGIAYTEDLNVLQDRGVPIYKAISEQLHISIADVKKMASEGKLSSEVYIDAFNGIANGVKGASDAQSKTFTGMISTFKDDFDILAGAMSKPLFNALKDGMNAVSPILDAFVAAARGDMDGFKSTLESAFGAGPTQKIMNFIDGVRGGLDVLGGILDKAKEGMKGIFALLTGNTGKGASILNNLGLSSETILQIENYTNKMREGMKLAGDAVKKVIGIAEGLFALFTGNKGKGVSILNVIGLSDSSIQKITAGVAMVKSTIKEFFSNYIGAVTGLLSGKGNLGESFTRIFNVIKSIALPILKDAIKFIMSIIAQVKKFWDENGAQIIQAIKNFWSIIAAIFEFIRPVLMFIIESIWGNIKGVIQGALTIIMGVIKIFSGLFTGDFGKMWEGVKDLFFGAVEFIWNAVQLLFIGKIFGGIKAGFIGVLESAKSWGGAIKLFFTEIKGSLGKITDSIVKWITGGFKAMGDEVSYIWTWLRNTGSSVWNAIWNTLRSIVTNLKNDITSGFRNAVDGAINFFQSLPGRMSSVGYQAVSAAKGLVSSILSSLSGMGSRAVSYGLDVMTGLFNGITNGAAKVLKKARDIADSIGNTIKKALGINSPSKVTTEIGDYTTQGLEIGMGKRVGNIAAMAKKMAKAAIPDVRLNDALTPAMGDSKYSSQYKATITVPVIMDSKEVARVTTKHTTVNQYRNKRDELRAKGLK